MISNFSNTFEVTPHQLLCVFILQVLLSLMLMLAHSNCGDHQYYDRQDRRVKQDLHILKSQS